MSSIELTPAVVQELLEKHRETLLESLAKMLQSAAPAVAPVASAGAPVKGKKEKKAAADPNAPPKEKRPPNAWILFTIRVEKVVRDAEKAAEEKRAAETPEEPKKAPLHTMATKQFASELKTRKAYDEWTDDEIAEALTTWTPPETSKRAAAKAASETGSVAEPEADAEGAASEKPAAPEKPKRQWSEETKAAAAAKRAATLAAKKAAAPEAEAPAPEAPVAPAPAAVKSIAIKPKAAPPAEAPKKVDLSFFLWTHEGKTYYTNDRGDVVTTDFEWVGRFDGKALDESVPEPDDLGSATLRE